ncbi:MAG: uroporphyrinogen-III C-methyltransferase, partial [Litorivicinus sp.]
IELIEGNRAQEYLLAEVEYLLRIAIQRVQAGRDVATGLALLQSADQALATADDAALFPVRRALASEIAALRAVPSLDRTGLYLKLAAAAEQVDALRMSPTEIASAPAPESADAIDGALKTLASFVTVRRRDNPVEPMLAPTEAAYVRQNLRLMMEQSQLALLDGDSATWQASLGRAQDWVGRYFLASDTQTTAMLETLAPLGDLNIAPELPRIGESLNALRAVQKARVDALVGGQ